MEQDTGATGAARAHVICRQLQGTAGRAPGDTPRWGAAARARLAWTSLQPHPSALTPLPVAWEGRWDCTSVVLILFKLFKKLSYGMGNIFFL